MVCCGRFVVVLFLCALVAEPIVGRKGPVGDSAGHSSNQTHDRELEISNLLLLSPALAIAAAVTYNPSNNSTPAPSAKQTTTPNKQHVDRLAGTQNLLEVGVGRSLWEFSAIITKYLLPTGDPALSSNDNPAFISNYTPYMVAYIATWLGSTQFLTRSAQALASGEKLSRSSYTAIYGYGLLWVLSQYIYAVLVAVNGQSSGKRVRPCEFPRVLFNFLVAHLCLALVGLVDLDLSDQLKAELIAKKKEENDPNPTRVYPLDDVKYILKKPRNSKYSMVLALSDLVMAKPVFRVGIFAFVVQLMFVVVVCEEEGSPRA